MRLSLPRAARTLSTLLVCGMAGACGTGNGTADLSIPPASLASPAPGPIASPVPGPSPAETPALAEPGFHVLAQYTDSLHAMLYANGFVYAVHSTADAVEIFDAATLAPVKTLTVGHVPGRLALSGSDVLVLNYLARDEGDAYLSIVDSRSNTVTRSLTVSEKFEGSDPDNHPFTNFPFDLTVAGSRAYVVFPTNPTLNLMPIDLGTWTERPFLAAGSGPGAMAAVGTRLVVTQGRVMANPNDDVITVFEGANALKQFDTGGRLHDVVSANGKAWVAHADASGASPSSAATPGWLDVIDPVALTSTKVSVSAGPYGLALSGDLLYVMCQYALRVDVVDTKTAQVVRSIDLSKGSPAIVNPRGIAASPRGDVFIESDGMISAMIVP